VEATTPVEISAPYAAPATAEASAPVEASVHAESVEGEHGSAERPAAEAEPPAAPARAVPAATSLEGVARHALGRLGRGAALVLGGVLLVRYSMEQGFFSPEVRVALGGEHHQIPCLLGFDAVADWAGVLALVARVGSEGDHPHDVGAVLDGPQQGFAGNRVSRGRVVSV
jgi:hypothetical protein